MPSIEDLVLYLHAASGLPVRSTWIAAIRSGNYSSCPGLTYANDSKYCPNSNKTIKGHMNQSWQGFRSTKNRPILAPSSLNQLPQVRLNEVHIHVKLINKL